MRVTYAAPNRSHHYRYASILARAGRLHTFVSGFSRFSPHAALPEAEGHLRRADHLQNIYLASLRLPAPSAVRDELAYLSKCWIDRLATRPAHESDLFLFYNGAGETTARSLRDTGVLRVVEAVNSHVGVQEKIMREEHTRLGLPFRPFHARETARRLREYDLADALLCPSRFVRDSFLQEGFPAERIFVVPYGIPEPPPGAPIKTDNRFRVLYVGQLGLRKGLRYLVEAFRLLRHPRKELLLVGPTGSPSGLEGIDLPEGVRFTGILKDDALALAYRRSSVFVLPTIEEGLALVLGEAMSHGKPIITTVNSGGDDLFQDGREGWLVPIRDPEALAGRMQQLADDPARCATMGQAAAARARELGGWQRSEALFLAALDGMAQLPPRC